ncbi:MAG: thiamine pyrophosphate-dependent enzyme [Patescibacteria group bacterium]|nr:thiamine pyrophosphate-dependent enzyme [Patescibacteria group bacterium]MDD5491025.1 thiamine pyrophosphate-dependent enzyme [Patescibacteria group bacterium]
MPSSKKIILSGNEAIARGAYEAGLRLAAGYAGTPASEVMNYLVARQSDDFYAEWSSDEKVALEVCLGASTLGQRSLCSMKANGFNICLDTLMSLTKKGITGGMVFVVVDDPEVRYSDVYQDTREFMKIIGFTILEPQTIEECYSAGKESLAMSEEKGQPVFIRITNKLGHLYAPLEVGEREAPRPPKFDDTPFKFNPYSKEKEKIIPYFCPGCPHEGFYRNFSVPEGYIINGDIGCYEMAGFGNNGKDDKPIREIIDTLFVMGSGLSVSQGQLICGQKSIAFCGDGTFWHSGINGLINAAYHKHNIILIIMDNSCTGMTGQHPVPDLSIEKMCENLGCHVKIANPYKKEEVQSAVAEALENPDRINVIISRAMCMIKFKRLQKSNEVHN